MDKETRWLRVEVTKELYDEIVKRAKADDRKTHVYLRRHLESFFAPIRPRCLCKLGQSCPECVDYVYHGTEIRTTQPWEKFKAVIEPACLLEGATGPMSVVCPCPKCATTCGLVGESVHGTPTVVESYQKSSCEGGGHVGPCGMTDCTHCNPIIATDSH